VPCTVTLITPSVFPVLSDDASPRDRRRHEVLSEAIARQRPSLAARMWAYRGVHLPINVFDFTVSRDRCGPDDVLSEFRGFLMADCWSGCKQIHLRSDLRITRVACMTHARRKVLDSLGNSTFDAARISRFEVTRVAVPSCWRSFHGLGAAFFCVRSSDSAQLSSYAVLHSGAVASRVCGKGRSESPSTAVACLGCRLNSVSPDGDGAARRWCCNHSTLVSAVTRGETPPPAG
jgi:hypothetical protein